MAVLQVYQADLLKDMSTCGTIIEEIFSELCWATDMSLCANGQANGQCRRPFHGCCGHHGEASVAESYGIKDRDRIFLLDAPISPSGCLATRLIQSSAGSAILMGRGCRPPCPNTGPSHKQREAQKQSVVSCAPPLKAWGLARHAQQPQKRPDLRTIISKKKSPEVFAPRYLGLCPLWMGRAKIHRPAPSRHPHETTLTVVGGSGFQQNVECSLASCQDTNHLTSPQQEISKLVLLSEKLAV